MEKRVSFRPGRALVLSRTLLFALLLTVVVLALAVLPPVGLEWIALLGALLTGYLLVFCLSPLLAEHWLTRSRLILRQGWYFRAVVPFSEIVSVEAASEASPSRVPLGIHRPLGRPTLYVTGGRTGLVSVRLGRRRRFVHAFGLTADEIVFDVEDPSGFLAAYGERRGLLAPVEAERPDA